MQDLRSGLTQIVLQQGKNKIPIPSSMVPNFVDITVMIGLVETKVYLMPTLHRFTLALSLTNCEKLISRTLPTVENFWPYCSLKSKST